MCDILGSFVKKGEIIKPKFESMFPDKMKNFNQFKFTQSGFHYPPKVMKDNLDIVHFLLY